MPSHPDLSREAARERDRADPLAPCRERFHLPEGVIYLDGNSLGPLPKAARERVFAAVDVEWGRDLIGSWNRHGWIDLPQRAGAKIARLLGAEADEVIVADSVTVDLFKLLAAALELVPGRRVILTEASQFPTDVYIASGLAELLGERCELRVVHRGELMGALGDDIAVVYLTHVDFRTGELHDMARLTRAAHDHGALALWDLSHSTGAVELDLGACGVDLAVGCGYKYLNGGPGAPAFAHVARRHHGALRTPLQGWLGHRDPFAFDLGYEPAPGVGQLLCGTPPILSLTALDAALDVFDGVDLAAVRSKSVALGEHFLALVRHHCPELEIACPEDPTRRGSQISLRHPEGYAIVQALIARGVIGDFRAPDLLRFGLAPLYLRHVDVWDAARNLRQVLDSGEHRQERFTHRGVVT
jgi:kynureninase